MSAEAGLCVPGPSEPALINATACNLSTTGVGLLMAKSMPVETEFYLRLPSTTSDTKWIRCQVVRWNAAANGSCQLGAKFLDLVQTDSGEIPMLVDPFSPLSQKNAALNAHMTSLAAIDAKLSPNGAKQLPAKPATDGNNRTAKRVPLQYFSTGVLIEEQKLQTRKVRMHVQDISTRGVGFLCPMPMAKGVLVAFMLVFSNQKAKAILARVARCIPSSEDQFLIGAELVEACDQLPTETQVPKRWLEFRKLQPAST